MRGGGQRELVRAIWYEDEDTKVAIRGANGQLTAKR